MTSQMETMAHTAALSRLRPLKCIRTHHQRLVELVEQPAAQPLYLYPVEQMAFARQDDFPEQHQRDLPRPASPTKINNFAATPNHL
jgi:hypothetical protein